MPTKPTAPVLQSNADATALVYFGVAYEGSGTLLHDLSATGLNGTLSTTAIWNASGLFSGPDLIFPGNVDFTKYVSFASTSSFARTGSFSVLATVKLTLQTACVFAGCYGLTTAGSFDTGWAVGLDDGGSGKVKFFTASSVSSEVGDTLLSTTVLSAGTQYTIVCTYDSATGGKKIYINGSLDASNTWASGPCAYANAQASIGALQVNTGPPVVQPTPGEISYVAIYSIALDTTRITAHQADQFAAVRPTAATKLAVTTQPPGSVAPGAPFGLVVSAEDASSAVVTAYTANVTVAIAANPGSGTLSGTATVAAVAGVATFTGLSINNAGTGYTLTATSGALTSATTNSFNITGASATAFTLTGPSSGFNHNASTAFTFAPTGGLYTGTITPTMAGLAGTWAPTSRTWTSESTGKTFTFTPSAVGSGNANGTASPSLTPPASVAYTSTPQTLAVTPGALPTSATTVETFTGGGTFWLTSAPTFTPTGVAGVSIGTVTVTSNTSAHGPVTTGTATGTITWTDSTTGATETEVVAEIVNVLSIGEGFATGLSTVGYAVYDASGTLLSAWTTDGVTERGTSSGDYGAVIPLAQDGEDYEIRWSQTSGTTPPFVHDVRTATAATSSGPVTLAAAGVDAVTIETGINLRQAVSLALAALVGKGSGLNANAPVYKGAGTNTTRIAATTDANGNRSAVTLTPPA